MEDINVNAIADTLNHKVDLPTGKSQSDIDYVVAFQKPTAENNYTWYRKYKSGWVEQGGQLITPTDAETTITLPISMPNSTYSILITRCFDSRPSTESADRKFSSVWTKTATTFNCWAKWGGSTSLTWQVSGMIAE